MATIGSLIVKLLGDTGDFTAKMAGATKQFSKVGAAGGEFAKKMADAKRSLLSTAASAATAYVSFSKFMGLMGRLDELGKAARTIGTTSEELSKLQYAANLSGVTNLNGALQKYMKNLGDVKLGTGAAKKALDELGISASELSSLPLSRQLGVLAEKMKDLGKPEQLAVLTKLFGRSEAGNIAVLFENGAAGIRKMTNEAKKFGAVFDDAMTKKAEEFNDSIGTLKSTLAGLMAPVATEAAGNISRFNRDNAAAMRRRGGKPGFFGRLGRDMKWTAEKAGELVGSRFTTRNEAGSGLYANPNMRADMAKVAAAEGRLRETLSRTQSGAMAGGGGYRRVDPANAQWYETERWRRGWNEDFLENFGKRKIAANTRRRDKAIDQEAEKYSQSTLNKTLLNWKKGKARASEQFATEQERKQREMQGMYDRQEKNTLLQSGSAEAFSALRANMKDSGGKDVPANTKKIKENSDKQVMLLEKIEKKEPNSIKVVNF